MLLLFVLLIAAPLPLETVRYQDRHYISDDVIIRQQSFDGADDRLGQLQILDIAAGQHMHILHDRNGIVACNHSMIDAKQLIDSMINASSSVPITDQQSIAQIRQLGRDCAAQHRRRQKRFIFIAPGTYWCGMGNRAPTAQDIGPNSDIDRCCREHDACPYFIPRITNRYGYYNWRTHTLSYCTCDNR